MVFGSEGEGISAELSAGCASLLRIGQYGSTRSINVAAAAAVAMHTWILQHAGPAQTDLRRCRPVVLRCIAPYCPAS